MPTDLVIEGTVRALLPPEKGDDVSNKIIMYKDPKLGTFSLLINHDVSELRSNNLYILEDMKLNSDPMQLWLGKNMDCYYDFCEEFEKAFANIEKKGKFTITLENFIFDRDASASTRASTASSQDVIFKRVSSNSGFAFVEALDFKSAHPDPSMNQAGHDPRGILLPNSLSGNGSDKAKDKHKYKCVIM